MRTLIENGTCVPFTTPDVGRIPTATCGKATLNSVPLVVLEPVLVPPAWRLAVTAYAGTGPARNRTSAR